MDIVSPGRRSEIMARIRGKNTKPEKIIRSLCHALGYRFRLHVADLPGTPDIVFPRLRKVILVHGCFWHRHIGCKYAYNPKSNSDFWEEKFEKNVRRDQVVSDTLKEKNWDSLVIWECETRAQDTSALSERIKQFLSSIKTPLKESYMPRNQSRGHVAAASAAKRKSVTDLAAVLGQQPKHSAKPSQDFEMLLEEIPKELRKKALAWYKKGIRRGLKVATDLMADGSITVTENSVIAPDTFTVKVKTKFKDEKKFTKRSFEIPANEIGFDEEI